jgi:hypothetical protein
LYRVLLEQQQRLKTLTNSKYQYQTASLIIPQPCQPSFLLLLHTEPYCCTFLGMQGQVVNLLSTIGNQIFEMVKDAILASILTTQP